MTELLKDCLIVCPIVFLAGFVDAIAGGGGLISLPAYLIAGLPTHLAVGTNKTVSGLGTTVSVWRYLKNGNILFDVALISAGGSVIGATLGTNLALYLPDQALKTLLLIALPCVALFLTFNRGFGIEENTEKVMTGKKRRLLSFAIGLGIGGYDGLIGPGAGTFLIIAFTAVLGTNLLTSSACGRVANLASNLTSMVIYIAAGKVMYALTVPAAVFCGLGYYMGSNYAIKGGSKNVRKLMFVVLGLLFIKVSAELLGFAF
ncbi:MAG: sulfite exporter TauE/SafE family protein [Oscillospiraceae bacterium]